MTTMPTIYLPHGGGPWPWTPAFTPALATDYVPLRAYLEDLPRTLPSRPTGIVVVSAHWEAPLPTVTTSEQPTMLYDYYGFPADTYAIRWDAPGSPQLAAKVRQLLWLVQYTGTKLVTTAVTMLVVIGSRDTYPDTAPVVALVT